MLTYYKAHTPFMAVSESTVGITVHVFKIDAVIWNAFPKCVCGETPPQTGRLLPKIRRLLPRIGKFFQKNRKASSEER